MARQHAVKSQANFDGLFGRMEAEKCFATGDAQKMEIQIYYTSEWQILVLILPSQAWLIEMTL